ncbi:unnamed protein product [Bursaphelenchus xylophilus]|nr:unnamed protein product [Bursaphelenchus xylophilus]CAG9122875.1 unnamed protein product [Bursaphelenchus xylophilus]
MMNMSGEPIDVDPAVAPETASEPAPAEQVAHAEANENNAVAADSGVPAEAPAPVAAAPAPDVANKKDDEPVQNALQSIPTRQYLDQTVVPILLLALGSLAKERPADPIEYVANYLLKEKSRFAGGRAVNEQQPNN